MHLPLLILAIAAVWQAQAQSAFQPLRPPSIPLAVRSPYLNTWLDGPPPGEDPNTWGYLPGQYPRFWTSASLGWQGFIRVDGENYNWMGAAPGAPLVTQTSFEYTSTRSIFYMNAGDKVEMKVEFLSPVYPNDMMKQSMTSSYLYVSVRSLDGELHDVTIYTDVSGEWASGDREAVIEWEHGTNGGVHYHRFARQDQQEFQEVNDQASWGNWYYATDYSNLLPGSPMSQSGPDVEVRNGFLATGELADTMDPNFRAINDNWPVFALARNIGQVSADNWQTMLFTIGYTQDRAMLFRGGGDRPYALPSYWAQDHAEPDIVSTFFHDWQEAQGEADRIDKMVSDDSRAAAGDDYAAITSLAVRQTFGGLAYTGTRETPMVWQKEISSASWAQTVDVIFPTWPFMLYFDPNLIKYTLAPLVEYQEGGHYPNAYAMHDLGRYPKAMGYPTGDDEPMPLEESSSMILMMLSYAQKTGDTEYLREHHDIMAQWAEFLVREARIPEHQLSTDDFAGPAMNQTSLAIKGIIGLQAMSEVERLIGDTERQDEYAATARGHLDFWMVNTIHEPLEPEPVGIADIPHAMFQYNEPDSYGLLYNMYADKALNLNFIPQFVYDMQSDFYPTVMERYGVILDSRAGWTKLDWEMFSAAVASDSTRDLFVKTIADWINETSAHRALTDLYDVRGGGYPDNIFFVARPVVGGVFAPMSL